MTIEQYDIKLSRLSSEDIELVRFHRNSQRIQQFMAYKKTISQRQQDNWFKSIDNKLNYYFIIEYQGEKIGLINCKDVTESQMVGEGGIFIWKQEVWKTHVPVMATLAFTDSIFYEFKLSNKSYIQIVKDNKSAIEYNKRLGYLLLPGQSRDYVQRYLLTKGDYEVHSSKIRKGLQILTQDLERPRITGSFSPKNLDRINDYLDSS